MCSKNYRSQKSEVRSQKVEEKEPEVEKLGSLEVEKKPHLLRLLVSHFQSSSQVPRPQSGFTLIEIIIIILLLAIAIPAIIFPVFESSKQSYKSEFYLNALYLAEGKMEEVTRFKNVSGFSRVKVKNFNDTVSGFTRAVTFADYSSWRTICDVSVANPNIPDIKITTWFTNYSSL